MTETEMINRGATLQYAVIASEFRIVSDCLSSAKGYIHKTMDRFRVASCT